jgi:hypothetical protein
VALLLGLAVVAVLLSTQGTSSNGSTTPRTTTITLVPVLVVADGVHAAADADRLERHVGEVAVWLARSGVAVSVAPLEHVTDPARAALLVDHTEAAAACATVRSALSLEPRAGTVQVVAGGHISATLPLRQLYGMACEGRALSCPGGPVTGMVLVDATAGQEIDLAVVVAHELGHVLGLRHPYETDCGGAAASDGTGNLMALERDLAAGRLHLDALSLAAVTLTPDQVATIRAP